MNAKLKFGIHQLAVKVHLGECSLNYIGRYNTKWCAGSDLITERPFLHTRSVISLHQRWPRVSEGTETAEVSRMQRTVDDVTQTVNKAQPLTNIIIALLTLM